MKVLIACYTVLAIAAGARAAVQLATKASDAPVPYTLSAVAAVVYLVLAVSLRRGRRHIALLAAIAELIGVIAVGTAELSNATHWPDQTVWSDYGLGYALTPLILPITAIVVLTREQGRAPRNQAISDVSTTRQQQPSNATW